MKPIFRTEKMYVFLMTAGYILFRVIIVAAIVGGLIGLVKVFGG